MAKRFNVPPNWPTPPQGWTPEPGWQPDPAWGPAPEGWQLWVEQEETAATPREEAEPGAGSAEPAGSPAEVNGGQYRANYEQAYQQQASAAQPGAAKKFLSSTAGILSIIGLVLLALIVALALVIGEFFRSSLDSDQQGTDSSGGSSQIFGQSEQAEGETQQTGGEVKEYKGSGDQIIEISKPDGKDSSAWLEYEFKAKPDESFQVFSVAGKSSSDELSFYLHYLPEGDTSGSTWIDTEKRDRTEKIEVRATGDWVIRLHSVVDAPAHKVGDTIKGGYKGSNYIGDQAFTLDGGASKVKIKHKTTEEDAGLMVTALNPESGTWNTIDRTSGQEYEVSINIKDLPDKTAIKVDSQDGLEWEITFE